MKIYIIIKAFKLAYKVLKDINETADYFATLRSFAKLYPYATKEELEAEADVCPICQEDLESAVKLPCHHYFHKWCLMRWLETQHTCPLCREKIGWKEY